MSIPFVIDNQQHRMADALKEMLTQSVGKPLAIATAHFAVSRHCLENRAELTDAEAHRSEKRLEALL